MNEQKPVIVIDDFNARVEEVAQLFSVLLKVDVNLGRIEGLLTDRAASKAGEAPCAADITDANVIMDGAFYMAFGVRASDLMPYELDNVPEWVHLWDAAYELAHTNRFYHGCFVYVPDCGGSGSEISFASAWTSAVRWYEVPENAIARMLAYPMQPIQVSTGNLHYKPHQLATGDSVKGFQGMALAELKKIIDEK